MLEDDNTEGAVADSSETGAASLVAELESFGIEGYDDDADIVSIAALLGVDADSINGADAVDSQSEIEGGDAEAGETDDDPAEESEDADAAEGSAKSKDADGDDGDGTPESAEEANAKPVPKESRDMRVLRKSHAFRNEVEPVIASVRKELPEVVGIATALRAGAEEGLTAIRSYSESAANGLEAAILEKGAAEFIASKYGLDVASLETVLKGGGESIEPSSGLKEEISLLTEEGQEELAKLLKKSPVDGERVKRLEGQLQYASRALQQERVAHMQEEIDDKFGSFVRALKIEGKIEDLSEAMVVKLSKDKAALDAYNAAAAAAAEGRKADRKRHLNEFYAHMAEYVKASKPAAVAPAPKQRPASKPPAVPKATTARAAVAGSNETNGRAPSAAETEAQKFAKLLNFTKTRAKERGIAWQG